ncbi:MAG: DUF72 domain-containing protein [Gemmatimonadota bacterium]
MTGTLGSCRLRFGVAGWSYPDWEGVVYPPATRDRLRYLAGFVDLIEVNASFYGFIPPQTAESWLERTADLPDFAFSAKVHRSFTHEEPGPWGRAEARAFARGLEPIRAAGRLRALLFQFPFSFRDGPAARERLAKLAAAFAAFPLVLEVRHGSWRADEALAFAGGLGFSTANLDLPSGGNDFGSSPAATGEPGYLRLHGRNAAEWFRPDAGRDARYDYLYDDDELEEIARRIETLAGGFRELVVVTNNHYRGKAVANLAELSARVRGEPRRLPPLLVRTYPRLAAVATRERPEGPGWETPQRGGAETEEPSRPEGRGPRRAAASPEAAAVQRDLFEG